MTADPDATVRRVAEVLLRDYESQYSAEGITWLDFASLANAVLAAARADHVTEHAREMTGGWYLRRDEPLTESVYPLAQWIRHGQENGGKVYRRRIIVVADWEEVPGG